MYSWVERGTLWVKCLAEKHNTVSQARTSTMWSRVERTNHKSSNWPVYCNNKQWNTLVLVTNPSSLITIILLNFRLWVELCFRILKKRLNSQFHRKSFLRGRKRQSLFSTYVVGIKKSIPKETYMCEISVSARKLYLRAKVAPEDMF